jgi:two-component sensor histidine kinase
LIFSNDGIDFPEDIDLDNADTLGLRLVNALVEQLHGTICLERKGGAKFIINFEQEIE